MIDYIKKNKFWLVPTVIILLLIIIIIIGINPSSHNNKKKSSQREINTINIKKDKKKEEKENIETKIEYPLISDVIYDIPNDKKLKEKDEITISIKVESANNLTKVEGYFTPSESIPVSNANLPITFQYNKETGYFDSKVVINSDTYPCIWKLWYIRAYDTNSNYGEYTDNNMDFEVVKDNTNNKKLEVTPPEFSIESDSTLSTGDSFTITLNTTDDEKVSSIEAYFLPQDQIQLDKSSLNISFTKENNTYKATITINEDIYPTTWKLWYISILDKDGNKLELKDINFKFNVKKISD